MALSAALTLAPLLCSVQAAWRLTFSEDFDGDQVNNARWSVPNGGVHGSNELELYLSDDVRTAIYSLAACFAYPGDG